MRVAVWRWVRCSRLLPVRRGQFLRAGQVLAAVGQGFAFLLEQAEFLQVVRAKADEVALAGDGNLERLANPPGRIGRQPGAVDTSKRSMACIRPQTASWSRSE